MAEQSPIDLHNPAVRASLGAYWKRNLRYTVMLLILWAVAGLGLGILVADKLNDKKLPGTGYPLGFWFAHQGSIIVFVLLIFIYCILMNRLDARHHKELMELNNKGGEVS
jgi:putative solute:sodium symporter small subunit